MAWSLPSTTCPSSRANTATPPMKVPAIPRIWSFLMGGIVADLTMLLPLLSGPLQARQAGRVKPRRGGAHDARRFRKAHGGAARKFLACLLTLILVYFVLSGRGVSLVTFFAQAKKVTRAKARKASTTRSLVIIQACAKSALSRLKRLRSRKREKDARRCAETQPTSFAGDNASIRRLNTSSSEPTPSTTVSWPCWR